MARAATPSLRLYPNRGGKASSSELAFAGFPVFLSHGFGSNAFSPSIGCGASATRQFTDSTQRVLDFHRRPSEILAYASDTLRHAYRPLRDRLGGG